MTDIMFETALTTLIYDCLDQERCFSAGELAATLRHRDPSLNFRVQRIAARLDQMFEALELLYDIDGDIVEAVRMKRMTSGTVGRIPAGIPVWVYGPNLEDVEDHPFEVDIPTPPGQKPHVLVSGADVEMTDAAPTLKPSPPAKTTAATDSDEAEIRSVLGARSNESTLEAACRLRLLTETFKRPAHAQASLIMTI